MQRLIFMPAHHALLFTIALITFDFAAYLTTNMIQPGIVTVMRDLQADISLASASVSMYMAGGIALQWLLGPLSDRVGRRPVLLTGALVFTISCFAMSFASSIEHYLVARFFQGTSICFIATVGYVTVQETFDQNKAIKLMAVISSVVLIAPVIGPLAGSVMIQWISWKALFAIIAVMGLLSWFVLLLYMPETVKSDEKRSFCFSEVSNDFCKVFRDRCFLYGGATISLCYIPVITWVAVSPMILIDKGGLSSIQFAWTQVPIFGAIILANIVVARFITDPAEPRFIWRTVPIQLVGILILVIGNIVFPHLWLWTLIGLSMYAFGAGLVFSALYRLTLFSSNLPSGTASASLNILVLSSSAVSVEVARWVYFNIGIIAFNIVSLIASIAMVLYLSSLLHHLIKVEMSEA
ncbi:MFS transporter [Vibrio proteolyticus]